MWTIYYCIYTMNMYKLRAQTFIVISSYSSQHVNNIIFTILMKSTKVQTLRKILLNVITFGLKTSLHVLGEHNGTKTELYRTNTKSQGLVPAHFALIIIIVVHVVKHQSVLINTCRRQESLRMMLGSSSM